MCWFFDWRQMDAFCHEHEREEHEGIRSLGVTIQMSRKLWTRGTWREAEHRSSVHPHHPHHHPQPPPASGAGCDMSVFLLLFPESGLR